MGINLETEPYTTPSRPDQTEGVGQPPVVYNAMTKTRENVLGGGETTKRAENRDIKRSFGEYSDLMDTSGDDVHNGRPGFPVGSSTVSKKVQQTYSSPDANDLSMNERELCIHVDS